MMKKEIYKYIPENLDIDELLKKNPPDFNLKKDKLVLLVSLINEIRSYDYDKYDKLGGMVPLNSTRIQKLGIRNFPKYKEWLINAGVWRSDNQYKVKEKSMYYWFTSTYNTTVRTEIIDNNITLKNIRKEQKLNCDGAKKYPELFHWFTGLEIDKEGAVKYLYKKLEENTARRVKTPYNKFNSSYIAVDKFYNKQYFFTEDTVAGRLHTNLTNMKSEVRNFITYQGQQLVSIDYKNSQPLLSSLLFSPDFWNIEENMKPGNSKSSNKIIHKNITNFITLDTLPHKLQQYFFKLSTRVNTSN